MPDVMPTSAMAMTTRGSTASLQARLLSVRAVAKRSRGYLPIRDRCAALVRYVGEQRRGQSPAAWRLADYEYVAVRWRYQGNTRALGSSQCQYAVYDANGAQYILAQKNCHSTQHRSLRSVGTNGTTAKTAVRLRPTRSSLLAAAA
jgi:hypothetical protein